MKKGFSMVELLVVIAIILLLIAIIMPVYTYVTEQAKFVQCQSNMRNLHAGFVGYSTDHRGNLPFYVAQRYTLTQVAMQWAFPAMQYIVDVPDTNPYTNQPWKIGGDNADFGQFLKEQHGDIRDLLFCTGGDNPYFTRAYEGQRKYLSNYVGYLGPLDHCHAVGKKRDFQSSDPNKFNRPLRMGQDLPGTWLLADYHWSSKEDERWGVNTGHRDYNKNILHLDGSVVIHRPEYWTDQHEWLDEFPGK